MKLRIRRRIRTTHSEQWTLFDLDQTGEDSNPQNIGKLDLHYDTDMIYATLLVWSEFTEFLDEGALRSMVDELLEEITEPIGVPADYSMDYFSPSLASYKFYTNYDEDFDDDDFEDEEDEDDADEEQDTNTNGKWPSV